MLYRLKEWIRNAIIRLFMSGTNNLAEIASLDYNVSDYKARYIINSSIIICYENNEDVKYFRECRKHERLKKYILLAIDDYFKNISTYPQKLQLKKMILEDLSDRRNYKKLINIGYIFDSHLTSILAGMYCDYNAAGLPCFYKIEANEVFLSFIQYMQCIIISQRLNNHLKNGQHENSHANKQLATYELAKCLGIAELIPEVKMCKLRGDKVDRVGTLMNNALGSPPSDILPADRKNINIDTFLKDITTLEYFDSLCYQLDHRLDNYNVIKDSDGKVSKLVAFDNDANRTFFVSSKLPKRTYAGANCVLSRKGLVNRPYIDATFANHISTIDRHTLFKAVGAYMSKFQFAALWKRFQKLKKGIENTALKQKDFLVFDWSMVDVDKAADSRFGCTYFNLYLNDTVMLDRKEVFERLEEVKMR